MPDLSKILYMKMTNGEYIYGTNKDIGRYYIDSNDYPVPSVTTVLNKTSNKSDSIQQWRNRVGEEEADRITKQSTDIGSMVHEALENYLNDKKWNFSNLYKL